MSLESPPPQCKSYYKIVALLPDGRVLSVYDGRTEYRKNVTLHSDVRASWREKSVAGGEQTHATGGFYVYDTVEDCLKAHELFPRASALLKAKKAVARVLAWNNPREENTDREDASEDEDEGEGDAGGERRQRQIKDRFVGGGGGGGGGSAVRYGNKKVFSYVRLLDLLPFPEGTEDLASHASTGKASERRLHVIRARARTMALKEDVQRMEEKLRVSKFIQENNQIPAMFEKYMQKQ